MRAVTPPVPAADVGTGGSLHEGPEAQERALDWKGGRGGRDITETCRSGRFGARKAKAPDREYFTSRASRGQRKKGGERRALRGEESRTARAPAKALIAAHHASGGAHGSTIPMTRAPPRSSPVSCVIQPRGGTPRLPRFGSRRLFRAGSIGGSASPRAPQASTSMRRAASKLRARAARITSESAQ